MLIRRGSCFGALVLAGTLALTACGSSGSPQQDAGPDGAIGPGDAGVETPDGGPADGGDVIHGGGGEVEGGDGGEVVPFPDAGETEIPDKDVIVTPLPDPVNAPGWTFYGRAQGAPLEVYGVSTDEAGNLWVAGGQEGLFLLEKDASTFRKFTMADGLRPYGFMADGTAPPGDKYLNVISVAGGPANTVFVGYYGKRVPGKVVCENNLDNGFDGTEDASIYKSGDVDRVTLAGAGISVVHYDVSTGPGLVGHAGDSYFVSGREKICDIFRLVYDPRPDVDGVDRSSLWIGANHGFSRADPSYAGDPTCNGQYACSGLSEHIHPYPADGSDRLGAFRGIAPDRDGNVWAGGAVASTKVPWPSSNYDWFTMVKTGIEGRNSPNKFDFWPGPGDVNDDTVSAMTVAGDDTLWVASSSKGLAHLTAEGASPQYFTKTAGELFTANVTNVVADPLDGDSVWIGYGYAGGISRIRTDGPAPTFKNFGYGTLGPISDLHVSDIQVDRTAIQPPMQARRLLVGFTDFFDFKPSTASKVRSGVIGIYTGD